MNDPARIHDLLAGLLAPEEFVVDRDALAIASADAFFEAPPPLALLVPRSAATLATALPRLAGAGVAVVPRGAALSYSGGLAPTRGHWVALDLRHFARVLEIHDVDATVRVEAGCTWATLDATLAARGLRTPFRGPASGLHATLGGTLSQDAIFHGSARHGTAADSVLGLVVMLADGRVLRTGTQLLGATAAVPFGPDLTRLFLGACGTFGVLLEATLRVLPRPAIAQTAGYRCPTRAGALAALRAAVRHGDATEALLVDPSVTTRLARLPADDSGPPGRGCARDAPWLLGIATDGATASESQARLARIERDCLATGATRDGAGPLAPWQAEPFPPPRMLRAADGRRWVPVHGIVPHSRAAAALDALDATMQLPADEIAALDLRWSVACTAVGAGAVLVEANLTWPGGPNPVVDHYLGSSTTATAGAAGTTCIGRLRGRLVDALDAIGATHLQVGRLHPYRSRIDPVAGGVLDDVKQLLDPGGIFNPGVLGLDPHPRGDRR